MTELRDTVFRLSGALILLMSSGMHTGWTSFKINIAESWVEETSFLLFVIAHTSWFIGNIIGLGLSTVLLQHLGIKTMELLALSLFVLNGILLTIAADTAEVVTTAQVIGGMGSGIILINFITSIAELSLKAQRGRLAYLGMIFFLSGLFIFLFINSYLAFENDILFFVGVLTIVDSFIALIFNMTGTTINPSYLYFKKRDGIDNSRDCIYEDEMRAKLNELIADDQHLSELNIYFNATEPANAIRKQKVCLILINIINILVYSYMVNSFILHVLHVASSSHYEWIAPTLLIIRLVGCAIGYLRIDVWGRKKCILISGLGIHLALLFAAISHIIVYNDENSDSFWISAIFFMIGQIFYGLNSGLQIILASEIFPYIYRQKSIVFVEMIKNVVLTALIFLRFYSSANMFLSASYAALFVAAIGTLIATIGLHILLPELENLSLQECVDSFKIKIKRNYCVWVKS